MRFAVDCDLRRVHCVAEDGRVICTGAKDPGAVVMAGERGDLVLFEIASALDYTDSKAIAHNKRRWTIWNVACAAALDARLRERGIAMLVAPSHVWTRGYDLAVRTRLTGADAKNKDLREAQSMLWFHRQRPGDWVPLADFLAAV